MFINNQRFVIEVGAENHESWPCYSCPNWKVLLNHSRTPKAIIFNENPFRGSRVVSFMQKDRTTEEF
jgi:hypothetical protein